MVKRKYTILIMTVVLTALSANTLRAQDKQSTPKKQYKEFMKLQDERDNEHETKTNEKRKRHEELQTKETQKRMKKNKKRSARHSANKHEKSFLQRLFTKKPKGR